MNQNAGVSAQARTAQKNTQIAVPDCRKHEFRVATVGLNDKGDQMTYVFFCVHCLYRTAITDKIIPPTPEPPKPEPPKEGEETNG